MCARRTSRTPNASPGKSNTESSPVSPDSPAIDHRCLCCGTCCRWEGDVCLTEADISAIAAYLGLAEDDFINRYCRLQRNRRGLSLIDAPDGACIMLRDDKRCRINPVKPQQCRDFPHKWNFPGWEQRCPGARHSGQQPCSTDCKSSSSAE